MRRLLVSVLVLSAMPTGALAAGHVAPSGNTYSVGTTVVSTAPISGDLSAIGGSVVVAAPVTGDDLVLAGSVNSRAAVQGDLRALGGSISITDSIGGDLVASGWLVQDVAHIGGSVLVAAANAALGAGAGGPVTIYANNVALGGTFSKDVSVFSSGRVSLAPGTVIHGTFSYEAPEAAVIPASVVIDGGVKYKNTSYFPDVGTSRILSLISLGFFIIIRILGAIILAGLLAGLFPRFSETIVNRVFVDRVRDILLATLLGFAAAVATPVVTVLLMLTFVGGGLAMFIFVLYLLLFMLAVVYAGILVGGVFARRFLGRGHILWHDGVLGMAVLSLCTLIPYVGVWIVILCTLFTAGTLLQIFFRFAFPGPSEHDSLEDLLEV